MFRVVLLALVLASPTPSQEIPQNGLARPVSSAKEQRRPAGTGQQQSEGDQNPGKPLPSTDEHGPDPTRIRPQVNRHDKQPEGGWIPIATFFVLTGTMVIIAAYTCYAKHQADAMRESVDVSRRHLEAVDRPWISVEVSATEALTSDEQGARFRGELVIKNVGRSPASRVSYRAVLAIDRYDPKTRIERAIAKQRTLEAVLLDEAAGQSDNGMLVVPGSPIDDAPIPDPWQPKTSLPDDRVMPSQFDALLIGCVIYWDCIRPEPHWTRFAFCIVEPDPSKKGFASPPVRGVGLPVEMMKLPRLWGANSAT